MIATPAGERFKVIAEAMKARLESWPALQGTPAIVEEHLDYEAEINEAAAKGGGLCLTILYEGFANVDVESDALLVDLRYIVRAWGNPALADGQGLVATELASIEAAKALHGYQPEGEAEGIWQRITMNRSDTEPDTSWQIHAMLATVRNVVL